MDDRQALDCIATLLGTSTDWSPQREAFLTDIAMIIAQTERPHPGDVRAENYKAAFRAATGRGVIRKWDRAESGSDL